MLHSVDLERIGDVFVPVAAHFTHTIRKRNGQIINSHFEYESSEIELNPDFNTLGAFKINLPDGTPVTIKGIPIRYVWQNGKAVADVDEEFLDVLDDEIEQLESKIETQPTGTTNKKDIAVPNKPATPVDTEPEASADVADTQREVLSKSGSFPALPVILISLLIVGVVVWLLFRRVKA